MRGKEIRSLTGLRGIAAVYVVFYHLTNPDGSGLLHNFSRHGYIAVDLFFVLSGFVMSLTYSDDFLGHGSRISAYKAFLEKRFARIYPLYIIVTVLAIAVFCLNISNQKVLDGSRTQILSNILLIQDWGVSTSIVGPAWSISTEWAAYLIFPVLVSIALGKSKYSAYGLFLASWFGLIVIAYANSKYTNPPYWWMGEFDIGRTHALGGFTGLIRCMAGFSLGMLSYRWRESFHAQYSEICGLIVTVSLFVYGSDLLLVLAFFVFVPSLARDVGPVSRFLGHKPIFTLGVWSYSIYLIQARFNPVHQGALSVGRKLGVPGQGGLAIAVTVVAVIVCSAFTYKWVEKPMRNVVRNLFSLGKGMPMRAEPAAP